MINMTTVALKAQQQPSGLRETKHARMRMPNKNHYYLSELKTE